MYAIRSYYGQMSDHKGALLLFPALPAAKELLANKGYDSDWFRAALAGRGSYNFV